MIMSKNPAVSHLFRILIKISMRIKAAAIINALKEKVKKLEWINEVEGACRNKEREQQESGPR